MTLDNKTKNNYHNKEEWGEGEGGGREGKEIPVRDMTHHGTACQHYSFN